MDISDRDFKYHLFNCFERKLLNSLKTFEKIKQPSYIFSATFFAFLNYKTIWNFPFKRSFLTRIRISAHNLNIETGRYNSTPREQRLCKFCPSSVEDEKHFILHCPKYQNIRNSYNTLFQRIRTDDDLVREILDPKDLFKTKQICKFLKEANNIRNA